MIVVQYYTQRAAAGMIVSEATGVSMEVRKTVTLTCFSNKMLTCEIGSAISNFQGLGWIDAPGIFSEEQVAAWKVSGESSCNLSFQREQIRF